MTSVQFKENLLQESTVCALALGNGVHSALWEATQLPPGLRFEATPGGSCPARVEGTPTRVGHWSMYLRASLKVDAAHSRQRTLVFEKHISVSVVAYSPPSPYTPTIDWASGLTFGTYNNVGTDAVGDCTIATAADYEQIMQNSPSAPSAAPWLAEYATLAKFVGEMPGLDAGITPNELFQAWESVNQTGTQIKGTTSIATDIATLSKALVSAPVFVTVNLPTASRRTLFDVDATTGIISTPWSSPDTGPYGPTTSTEVHSALLVGLDKKHHELLLATWGETYAVPYAFFESMVSGAWTIQQ